jgi:hypothetical protein
MRSSEREAGVSHAAGSDRPANGHLWRWLIPRRRRYIVNWKYQLRASIFIVSLALIMLFLVNLNVYLTNKASTESILVVNPELRSSLEARDRRQGLDLALGSVVMMLGVFALGIFQSHKTAGAAFSLRRTLIQLRDGRYDTAPRLRRDDNLQELLAPIDDLARALREIDGAEMETLQAVMEALGRTTSDSEGREVTSKLLDIIQAKRSRIARPVAGSQAPAGGAAAGGGRV